MFERGLPGYDDWLDNHGNPGIEDEMPDFSWALEEPISVTQTTEGTPAVYRIDQIEGNKCFDLSFEPGGRMLFNGEFVDVGDDFIAYVSIVDEYHNQGGGVGKTIRQEPFDDGE
jgi:hypothetical protein